VDGLAFKDLDKDGELDVYEDWREDDETRAKDLVSQLSIDEKLPLMLLAEYDLAYSKGKIDSVVSDLDSGMRALCTPFSLGTTKYTLKYTNGIQTYTEAIGFRYSG